MDKITASLATIPSRVHALHEMIQSIINQVDVLQIFCNGFKAPIRELEHFKKIRLVYSQDTVFGDRGDAGKFYNVQNISGWHFICDDDIHYPENYVQSMISKSEEHKRKFVIGCHGGDFSKFPVVDSYKDRKNMSHYKKTEVKNDYLVHFLATNSVCFHDDTIQVNQEDFPIANMGDIWFGLASQKSGVGMICREKKSNWILDCEEYDKWDSIFGHRYNKSKGGNADVQTAKTNSISQWKHYGKI